MSEPKDMTEIAIPPSRKWSLRASRYLPAAVFAAGLLAAGLLWRHTVSTPAFQAEAENRIAELRAPQAGLLVQVETGHLHHVKAGDRLAVLLPVSPALLAAELAVLRAEMEGARASLQPLQGVERAGLAYERLRLDWMKQRVELAELRAKLVAAEDGLQRLERLRRDSVSSEQEYSLARNLRDGLLGQVTASEELVSSQERTIASHHLEYSAEDAVSKGIELLAQKLRVLELRSGPQALLAPATGQVCTLLRGTGEQLQAGDVILSIAPNSSARLVAYLRQPLREVPRPGMTVMLRPRRSGAPTLRSTIQEVGQSLQPVPRTLVNPLLPASTSETGLPVSIRFPEGLSLLPGELVDVSLLREDS